MALAVSDLAPDFTAETHDGKITLSALRGRKVVLYFYPKDNTPGCTTEACDFRDSFGALTKKKVVVLGISPDSVKSHQGFRAKHELPFTLVSDPDRAIATAYGVYQEKTMYGRTSMGIVRTTFLIDEQGTIVKIWPKVKVAGHVAEVLANT